MSFNRVIQPFLLFILLLLAGCADSAQEDGIKAARQAMLDNIRNETPGDYFIGRRYYKKDYKFWGFVRSPGQPWGTAKLVMLNEQQKLAPDREINQIGYDNNYEYKLYGHFSGETVYEPASNGFYPEFVLTGYEIIAISPAPIFRQAADTDPNLHVLGTPY
ncbi:MAG TPA: hypothetical protein VG733_10455 [Chthoniobacteraceae bacterium]|nr:hypothetical protein [Chthoniobacteraceae bacterium]